MDPGPELLPLGVVARPFGIRGELRVHPYNPDSRSFLALKTLLLRGETTRSYELLGARPHQGFFLLTLKGVKDRNDAERLRGCEVLAKKSDLPPLGEGEYYWYQLVGLTAYCEGRPVGPVLRLENTSPGGESADLLVVEQNGREILIPLAGAIVRAVDVAGGRIELHRYEGLWDDPV